VSSLTLAEIGHAFTYNPKTGVLRWWHPRTNSNKPGDIAGSIGPNGYRQVRIGKIDYLVHRLIWFYIYGAWPRHEIDHINGDRADNRLANLREANKWQQQCNSKSHKPHRGVFKTKNGKRWRTQLKANGKLYYLGTFDTETEASACYASYAELFHGEYAYDEQGRRDLAPKPGPVSGASGVVQTSS
jgi:HNH endonuclease/AP2 domain